MYEQFGLWIRAALDNARTNESRAYQSSTQQRYAFVQYPKGADTAQLCDARMDRRVLQAHVAFLRIRGAVDRNNLCFCNFELDRKNLRHPTPLELPDLAAAAC